MRGDVIRVCMIRVCRWLYHAQKSSEPSTENQLVYTDTHKYVWCPHHYHCHLGGDGGFTPRCVTTVMKVPATCLGMFQISAQHTTKWQDTALRLTLA